MIDSYRTLYGEAQAKIVRKKSRFIAVCYHVSSPEEVSSLLEKTRHTYHDASHRCYAYRLLGKDTPIAYSSDAGEPAGSAGLPILQQIEKYDLYDVLVIVVRYFGGTKLGIGGLIHAYGDATAEALTAAKIVTKKQEIRLSVHFPPEISSRVMGLIHRHPARVEDVRYEKDAHILVALPVSCVERFTRELTEATGARAHWEERHD
ncbi:MAG: YigZ family protein [Candidatus Bipolaricaulota bacterium]|nr:YigZ family protein [Candidatus Bipolaricaulota bacterium]